MTVPQLLKIKFPVGRMVSGSIYNPVTKDPKGNPLVYKSGAKKDQPRIKFDFGVAIAKQPGHTHWNQTDWGAQFHNFAVATMAAYVGRDDFAFKIVDGDSTKPNKENKRPCDRNGFPGHWVVYFSNSNAPKLVNKDGSAYILEKDALKCGYYIEVFSTIKPNGDSGNPGMYNSPEIVSLQYYGEEISYTPDPSTVGFGGGAAPAGASAVPVAGAAPVTPVATVAVPVVAAVAPQVPGAVPPPRYEVLAPVAPPPPPTAPVGPQPTAKAAGASIEQMMAWPGWTMELLVANGYIA